MNILVLGGTGFIGSYLLKALSEKPDVKLSSFSRSKLELFDCHKIEGDIFNKEALSAAILNKDIIYYCVGSTSPGTNPNDLEKEVVDTFIPFKNTLDLAIEHGVKKVVLISSAGTIYGKSTEKLNESSVLSPFSPYGIVKKMMEDELLKISQTHSVASDIFRISNPYGNGLIQGKKIFGVIGYWINALKKEQPLVLFQSETEIEKDFVYIEDVADLMSMSINSLDHEARIFNLGSGKSFTLKSIVKMLEDVSGKSIEPIIKEATGYDNPIVKLDVTKLQSLNSGFEFTDMKTALQKMWNQNE